MENTIAITGDLADLFLSLSELEKFSYSSFNKAYAGHSEYTLKEIKDKNIYDELFSILSHLLILYDKIEIISRDSSYKLNDSITTMAEIPENIINFSLLQSALPPVSCKSEKYDSNDLAKMIKPVIMSACKNNDLKGGALDFAKDIAGSIENLFSYLYDREYNRVSFEENQKIENYIYYYNLERNPERSKSEYISLHYVKSNLKLLFIYSVLHDYLTQYLTLVNFATNHTCDIYSPLFSNLHTAKNTDDAYCLVKNQISMIIDEQPAFNSLKEIMDFRKNKHRDIVLLRDEVSQLETLIRQGDNEAAIQKAISDVRSANQSLLKNTTAKKTTRIATYISVPISLLEFFTLGTSYSMAIGVVGTIAQLIADQNDAKQNWLFVAR